MSQPTIANERINLIDSLRGFALFGILLVNITNFTATAEWNFSGLNSIIISLIYLLAVSKFYLLFSFLFGLGFAIQMDKLRKEKNGFWLYLRRVLMLFAFGLFNHLVLLWGWIDILKLYAILGLILLFLRKMPTKILPFLAILSFSLAIAYDINLSLKQNENLQQIKTEQIDFTDARYLKTPVLGQGSYKEIFNYNWQSFIRDPWANIISTYSIFFRSLAMMFLGFWAGRVGLFRDIRRNLPFFKQLLQIALPVIIICTLFLWIFGNKQQYWWSIIISALSFPALALTYIAVFALLSQKSWFSKISNTLAPAGQMALTNYLTQSLLVTLICFGYGFGLYNKLSHMAALAIVISIYVLQIIFSRWWFKYFQFGPAEWLWRSFTYLRWQPFKQRSDIN